MAPPARLEGVRAVVTGGSRGLGRAVVAALAAEGARVIATARSVERLEAVVRDTRPGPGGEVLPAAFDLDDAGSVEELARTAGLRLGRVDVLVNNAWRFDAGQPLAEVDPALLERRLAGDLAGTLRLTHALVPLMGDGAVIVNVTSNAAGRPGRGIYGFTKAALETATVILREELAGRGIRCVAVDPGPLRTEMRRLAHPGEDPATVPHPRSVAGVFVDLAAGAEGPWRVEASAWTR